VMCTATGGVAPCDDATTCVRSRDRGEGFPDLNFGDGLFDGALATGGLLIAELASTCTWARGEEEGYMVVAGYVDGFEFWFGMLYAPGRE
jgi:hypothetical protein